MKSSLQLSLAVGGRKGSHGGFSNRSHLSKALTRAYVPLQVVIFPVCRMCEVARNQQKHAEQCRAELLGCRPLSEAQWRNASCSIRLNLLERLSVCSCEQCAKVDPRISTMSARDRSTIWSRLQRSQAAGPTHVKSGGRESETMPASKKQHSGKLRSGLVGSCSVLSKLR